MSYARGMSQRLGLIVRRPTHTYGFRGLRFMYERPTPRMSRVARLGRLADSGYSDPVTGEWIDTSYGTYAPAAVVTPDSLQTPMWGNVAPSMLTPADTIPKDANYNPNLVSYFDTSLAQKAAMALNSAFTPSGATAQQIAAAPAFSSSTLMWVGGGLVGLFLLSSMGGGRRRR